MAKAPAAPTAKAETAKRSSGRGERPHGVAERTPFPTLDNQAMGLLAGDRPGPLLLEQQLHLDNQTRATRFGLERQADVIAARLIDGRRTEGSYQRRIPITARPSLVGGLSDGHSLPRALRQPWERALGVDLGTVRIDTSPAAALAADRLGAHAFASGTHIGFGAGEFAPQTREGRALIAHEVAHVVQQAGHPRAVQLNGDAERRRRRAAIAASLDRWQANVIAGLGAVDPRLEDYGRTYFAFFRHVHSRLRIAAFATTVPAARELMRLQGVLSGAGNVLASRPSGQSARAWLQASRAWLGQLAILAAVPGLDPAGLLRDRIRTLADNAGHLFGEAYREVRGVARADERAREAREARRRRDVERASNPTDDGGKVDYAALTATELEARLASIGTRGGAEGEPLHEERERLETYISQRRDMLNRGLGTGATLRSTDPRAAFSWDLLCGFIYELPENDRALFTPEHGIRTLGLGMIVPADSGQWGEFGEGFVIGGLQGLLEGLGNMLLGIVGAVAGTVAMTMGPQFLVGAVFAQLHPDVRAAERRWLRRAGRALQRFRDEVEADPSILMGWQSDLAVALGRQLSNSYAIGYLRQGAYERGRLAGEVYGQIVFEVLLQVFLLLFTRGAGNVLRAARAAEEGAEGAGFLVRVVRRLLSDSPAFARLVNALSPAADANETRRIVQAAADAADASRQGANDARLSGALDEGLNASRSSVSHDAPAGPGPPQTTPHEPTAPPPPEPSTVTEQVPEGSASAPAPQVGSGAQAGSVHPVEPGRPPAPRAQRGPGRSAVQQIDEPQAVTLDLEPPVVEEPAPAVNPTIEELLEADEQARVRDLLRRETSSEGLSRSQRDDLNSLVRALTDSTESHRAQRLALREAEHSGSISDAERQMLQRLRQERDCLVETLEQRQRAGTLAPADRERLSQLWAEQLMEDPVTAPDLPPETVGTSQVTPAAEVSPTPEVAPAPEGPPAAEVAAAPDVVPAPEVAPAEPAQLDPGFALRSIRRWNRAPPQQRLRQNLVDLARRWRAATYRTLEHARIASARASVLETIARNSEGLTAAQQRELSLLDAADWDRILTALSRRNDRFWGASSLAQQGHISNIQGVAQEVLMLRIARQGVYEELVADAARLGINPDDIRFAYGAVTRTRHPVFRWGELTDGFFYVRDGERLRVLAVFESKGARTSAQIPSQIASDIRRFRGRAVTVSTGPGTRATFGRGRIVIDQNTRWLGVGPENAPENLRTPSALRQGLFGHFEYRRVPLSSIDWRELAQALFDAARRRRLRRR